MPASPVSFKIHDAEFNATLRQYSALTKRDLTTIINTKAFYISRGAVRNTHRTSKETINRELNTIVRSVRMRDQDTKRLRKTKRAFSLDASAAPRAALIINALRGKEGKPGLFGEAMRKAVYSLWVRRQKSRAFIASGFLPAVKTYEPLAERPGSAPRRDPQVKAFGHPKGGARPATQGWNPKAIFWNSASAKGDHKGALIKYGGEGLAKAFAEETKSMLAYIERKMKERLRRVGIRFS